MNVRVSVPALMALLVTAGCSSPAKNALTVERDGLDSNYPFSEVEAVYDTLLDAMTSGYFRNHPELDKEHTSKMQAYIRSAYPRDKFVELMVRDQHRPVFERGKRELDFRQTKEFKDAFEIVIGVSVPIARMVIGGQRDIYVAKFVEKDPMRVELLEMAKTEDEQQFASWAYAEVPIDKAKEECGDELKPMAGTRVFGFCSPPETWENLCGRQGYLVVREGAIVQTIVTMMN